MGQIAVSGAALQYVKGMTFNNMSIMLPWFSNLIDEDRALLGDDWWPYGIQRYHALVLPPCLGAQT